MGSSAKIPTDLKWIEDEIKPLKRPPDDFDTVGNKTFANTIGKKSRENIFVPLGLIATVTCLALGLSNMRKGDSKKQQMFMRGRVGFQAFTLAAMTIGTLFTVKRGPRTEESHGSSFKE